MMGVHKNIDNWSRNRNKVKHNILQFSCVLFSSIYRIFYLNKFSEQIDIAKNWVWQFSFLRSFQMTTVDGGWWWWWWLWGAVVGIVFGGDGRILVCHLFACAIHSPLFSIDHFFFYIATTCVCSKAFIFMNHHHQAHKRTEKDKKKTQRKGGRVEETEFKFNNQASILVRRKRTYVFVYSN